MNNIKKTIFKIQTEIIIPPEVFRYDLSAGQETCDDGVLGTINAHAIVVYTSIPNSEWVVGTKLYQDANLTLVTTENWITALVGFEVFYLRVSGTLGILSLVPTNTPC